MYLVSIHLASQIDVQLSQHFLLLFLVIGIVNAIQSKNHSVCVSNTWNWRLLATKIGEVLNVITASHGKVTAVSMTRGKTIYTIRATLHT